MDLLPSLRVLRLNPGRGDPLLGVGTWLSPTANHGDVVVGVGVASVTTTEEKSPEALKVVASDSASAVGPVQCRVSWARKLASVPS